MDPYTLDDNISTAMQDLERSYCEIELSNESLNRVFDTYVCLNELVKTEGSLSVESFKASYTPALKLAFAGTDVDVDALSNESAIETIKIIAKAILEAIKRLFNSVMDALSNLDIAATWMTQQCNLMERKRVTSVGKTAKSPTVEMGRQHRFLRIGRIFTEDSIKLTSELKNLSDVIAVINTDYTTSLIRGASKLSNIPKGLHDGALGTALVHCVDEIGLNRIASKLGMRGIDNTRFGRANVMATNPLLGGQSLFYLNGNLVEKGPKGLRFHGFVFDTTSKENYKVDDKREFRSMSPADMTGLPELIRKILGQVSKGSSDDVRNHMKKLRSDLERYINSKMSDPDISDTDMGLIRSTINAFSYWSHSVTVPLYGSTMSVCRATLSYAQASVKTWG